MWVEAAHGVLEQLHDGRGVRASITQHLNDLAEFSQRILSKAVFVVEPINTSRQLAPLGVPMLRYIREDRGVTNLPALRKWYYEEAPGINELRFWSVLDEIQRVLLDDAFERKNFTLLDGNRECVERLINQRIVTSIGAIPFPSDEATLGTYREAKRILLEQIVVELAPRLKNMLTETNGVLVKNLMEHIDEPLEQLRQRIADLAPLLGDLLSGRGPSGAALSDLEADLIAIVYHTTSSTIRSRWSEVIGREKDVASLVTGAQYSMNWDRNEQRLDSAVDSRGLQALSESLRFSACFSAGYREDMHKACHGLSPKRLEDVAADVWSLALHLGVLMAIAGSELMFATGSIKGLRLLLRWQRPIRLPINISSHCMPCSMFT